MDNGQKLLFHPKLKKILIKIGNENNKTSEAKLAEMLIEFSQEDDAILNLSKELSN